MRAIALRVDATPLAPAAAHAEDAVLLGVAARGRSLLRVYALGGDVVSLGRYHRRPAGAAGVALHRRRTGGRVAASGEGFAHVALYLPHRAALVADDPRALAPEQVLNRCVRGLLGGLEVLGVPAAYPGRDLVTARGRPLAVLGLEVAASGATLVDAIVSLGRDQSLLPHLLDRADPEGAIQAAMVLPDQVASVARETGRTPALAELAAAVRGAMLERLGVACSDEGGGQPLAGDAGADDGWLDERRVRPELFRRVRLDTMLGTLEVDLAVAADGTVAGLQLVGDVLAPSTAVARLEAALCGCQPDVERMHAAIRSALAPPDFLLGLRSLRALAEAIARACG